MLSKHLSCDMSGTELMIFLSYILYSDNQQIWLCLSSKRSQRSASLQHLHRPTACHRLHPRLRWQPPVCCPLPTSFPQLHSNQWCKGALVSPLLKRNKGSPSQSESWRPHLTPFLISYSSTLTYFCHMGLLAVQWIYWVHSHLWTFALVVPSGWNAFAQVSTWFASIL